MSELAPAYGALFPPLVLAIYIACIAGAGALANCALLAAVLKWSKNGLFSIILQLAIADIVLLGTSIGPELWSYNAGTWIFGRNCCIAYRGISIFASTASLYLVATIALHSLATANLEEKASIQKNIGNDREDDEEMRSSRHSLVASETSTPPRTMNVDYRLTDTRVPVAPPTVFVWVLSASLSIPEFTFATTVSHNDVITCTLVDTSHRVNMHTMVAFFNFFLPALILSSASVLILCKLKSKNILKLEGNETVPALKLSLWLIFVHCVLCAPRSFFYVYGLYNFSVSGNADPEHDSVIFLLTKLILSALYLAATLLRPILCMSLLPRLRKIFSLGFKNLDKV